MHIYLLVNQSKVTAACLLQRPTCTSKHYFAHVCVRVRLCAWLHAHPAVPWSTFGLKVHELAMSTPGQGTLVSDTE